MVIVQPEDVFKKQPGGESSPFFSSSFKIEKKCHNIGLYVSSCRYARLIADDDNVIKDFSRLKTTPPTGTRFQKERVPASIEIVSKIKFDWC
jgi:hypothetical protein